MKRLLFLSICLLAGNSVAQTILHYRVSDTDTDTVANGTTPGFDGSEDGITAFGTVTLSEDVPTDGVPTGAGNRSLVFDGASGVNLPGTAQLLNSVIETAGGFTYEAWFKWGGGGQVNSIIDYAGTEKLVRQAEGSDCAYRNNSAAPLYLLGLAPEGEWHYAAVVFEPTDPVSNGSITGNLTFYFDSTEPTETIEAVTISDFGDSLNRTIAVGAHPLGFAGDFITGLIFEPRVSLGALTPEDLLFRSLPPIELEITEFSRIDGGNRLTFSSEVGLNYIVEYSMDLLNWFPAGPSNISEGESSVFVHNFSPGFESLATAPQVFYRVVTQP